MAHHKYLIRYANGIKRHVSESELANSGRLERLGPREFKSLDGMQQERENASTPSYLYGNWVFELKGKKSKDIQESPQCLIRKMTARGLLSPSYSQ